MVFSLLQIQITQKPFLFLLYFPSVDGDIEISMQLSQFQKKIDNKQRQKVYPTRYCLLQDNMAESESNTPTSTLQRLPRP